MGSFVFSRHFLRYWGILAAAGLLTLGWAVGLLAAPATPPTAIATLQPDPAYVDHPLRGSARVTDPAGDPEGASRYRWLRNGTPVLTGTVPQTLLLPLDGEFMATDGVTPTRTRGLTWAAGRFGSAVVFSPALSSRLTYSATDRAAFAEGTFEAWIRLAHDLNDPVYDQYPRLFSLVADSDHLFCLEINADRLIATSRNSGMYYGTWPAPPNWRSGEWHYVAATWSALHNRVAIYYDGVLADAGEFPALSGEPAVLDIGSNGNGGVLDAAVDEVRLSRRALTEEEIAEAFRRGDPAPHDEVLWRPGEFAVGDRVTFELTPCDAGGACGAAASAAVTITAPPLGPLTPEVGLLPAGTVSATLHLTTTASADCRWADRPDTLYAAMPNVFQVGQGTPAHQTVISGLVDLGEYRVYVRCRSGVGMQPRAGSAPEDTYERSTHLRVLGPWADGYPRIANIWGSYDAARGVDFFSGYDLFIPGSWENGINRAAELRAANPHAKILLALNATYSNPGWDPLTAEWMLARPGDPAYACLLRNHQGGILMVSYWNHPMYNMTQPYCVDILARNSIAAFQAAQPALSYDGIYWDRLHDTIDWLGSDIDADLDGTPDEPAVLNAAYVAGMKTFFTRHREALPGAVLMGNDGPQVYSPWINGRLYEWQLGSILDGDRWLSWDEVVSSYRDWSVRGPQPHMTFIESAPEALYSEKYTFRNLDAIPPAMEAEAAASYSRMRYGLTSALMGDGLFSYDYGADWHGNPWWYDEFGATPGYSVTTLPPRGYLGQPQGDPFLLVEQLTTPDQIENGGFEAGLTADWHWYLDTAAGVSGTVRLDPTGGISGTAGAQVIVTATADYWDMEFRQDDIATVAGESLTLSFWARSSVTRTVHVQIIKQSSPWTNYGFSGVATVTPQWQHFHLTDAPTVTASDGKVEFLTGETAGSLWLDGIQLQSGALGIRARRFDHGLAVVNPTVEVQGVPLPEGYCRLNGTQAPLFQVRVDDEAAASQGAWMLQSATFDQFGEGVRVAEGGSGATLRYTPTLAYAGMYEVLAWVAPAAGQSRAVSVTLRHAGGQAQRLLDLGAGEVGWHSLGRYSFAAGSSGSLTVTATGSGAVVADAFKWVSVARYNDGRPVTQLTLQPRDGIVLLDTCFQAADRSYLPVVLRP